MVGFHNVGNPIPSDLGVDVEGDVSEHGGNAVEVDFEAVDFA